MIKVAQGHRTFRHESHLAVWFLLVFFVKDKAFSARENPLGKSERRASGMKDLKLPQSALLYR